MTDDQTIETLAFVHHLITEMEELVATNNLIAGGLVTDRIVVRETAARSNVILSTMLLGHQKMLEDGYDKGPVKSSDLMKTIYDKD